jgi:hypothetical protein
VKLTSENLKKLDEKAAKKQGAANKPKWALTEEEEAEKRKIEEEERQRKEEQELLNFASGLDYDSYVNDLEVGIMLKALKQRINELQQDENWRKKVLEEQEKKSQKKQQQQQQAGEEKPGDDVYDKITQSLNNQNDEAKSVASEKSMSRRGRGEGEWQMR